MPTIDFPRSDGDPNNYPIEGTQNPSGWHERLPLSDVKHKLYRSKIGLHLAEKQGKPNPSYWEANLPEDYALFAHKKPQPDGSTRVDVYFYGSKHCLKFRSPAEFLPHADWLMDTSKNIEDHSECVCKYSSGSRRLGASSTPDGPRVAKRPAGSSSLSSPRVARPAKRPAVAKEDSEVLEDVSIEPQRVADLKIQNDRPYRKGELVWMEIPKIEAPAVNPPLPSITHWPSLVTDTTYKTRNSVYPPGHPNVGEVKIVQFQAYTLRPLGFFNSKAGLPSVANKLLPWKAGSQIMGGSGNGGWQRFMQAGEEAMEAAMPQAAMEAIQKSKIEAGKSLSHEDKWKLHWGRRSRFDTVGQDWTGTVIRMGMAIRQGLAIADSYCLTDKIDPASEWLSDPERRKVTEWQGVYSAGERIWADDTVRVCKSRTSLPTDVLPPPGPGSENFGVFLRVHSLRVQMLSQADPLTGIYEWLLKVSGDLYELYADKSNSPPTDIPSLEGKTVNGLETGYTFPMVSPPPGYAFRKINPDGVDAILDMTDIAGRVYTNLLQGPHFKDPANSRDPAPLYPDTSILSLAGLAPGTANTSTPTNFDHGLYDIMGNQSGKVESHYIELYKKWLGPEPSNPASGPGPAVGHQSGSGSTSASAAPAAPDVHPPGPGTLGAVLSNGK